MDITCIGCLHGHYPKLEGGDILIITGDLTANDTIQGYQEFFEWFCTQNYSKKIFISGNHDNQSMSQFDWGDERIDYLCDSGTEFEGLTIWGAPWTPWFSGVNPKCKAFMKSDSQLSKHWEKIPQKIDILITHGPAFGILDGIPQEDGTLYHAGSKSLFGWLKYVERPRYHIFGHIHEAYGQEEHFPTYNNKMMISANCSCVNERYESVNKPIRITL